MGPAQLRNFRIYQVNIQKIIEEGKVVKKGDWVATLDPSEFNTKLQDKAIDLEKKQSQFIQTQLDTTLDMRKARDELINLEYNVEEMKIKLEQSKYEPPATIKQAEIDLEKAKRAFEQATSNYQIKHQQNNAKMAEISAELRKVQNENNQMLKLKQSFTVLAPEDGMVVYAKGWDGKAMKAGSTIHTWDPVVATLPDLTVMLSKTFINEVDVRKIKSGLRVEIGLDAFPEKRFTGVVTRVANVGEQRPNSDSKVFETTVEINEQDDLLKPAMTTSNKIIVNEMDDVLFIPLECLHSQSDSITFVYKRSGLNTSKQEVQIGETNTDEAIILKGLREGDRVYLSVPNGQEDEEVVLLPELNGFRNQQKQEETKPEPAKTMIITMPDGSTKTVTEEQMKKIRQNRQGKGRPDAARTKKNKQGS
jgi:multidrug efflux pump subunit AcrA (membrane-fusion protein)